MSSANLKQTLESLHAAAYGWALVCCRSNALEAEEALQTSYIKVLQGKAKFGAQSNFKTWLFAVIRNTAREQTRRQVIRRAALLRWQAAAPVEMASHSDPAHQMHLDERAVQLAALLTRLSNRQQEVLHLVFYQSMTLQQASLIMNVSLGTARKHYERAKHRLRTLIEQTSDEPRRQPIQGAV